MPERGSAADALRLDFQEHRLTPSCCCALCSGALQIWVGAAAGFGDSGVGWILCQGHPASPSPQTVYRPSSPICPPRCLSDWRTGSATVHTSSALPALLSKLSQTRSLSGGLQFHFGIPSIPASFDPSRLRFF